MSALSYKKNDDIESGALDKMTVYQECQRAFAESPINARKCRKLLAKLIHLLTIGETFSEFEATGLFIAVSKLFPIRTRRCGRLCIWPSRSWCLCPTTT